MKAADAILLELSTHDQVLQAVMLTRRHFPTLREICTVLHPGLTWETIATQRIRATGGLTRAEAALDVLEDLAVRARVRHVKRDRSELDTLASLRFEAVRYLHPAPEAAIEGG